MMKSPTELEDPAYVARDADGEPLFYLYQLLWPIECGYPLWSQRDPEWANVQLGFGPTTIGQYGCLITNLAMALTNITDTRITPADVNREVKEVNGYSGPNKNLLNFAAISKIWPGLQFIEKRVYPKDPAPAEEMAKWVRQLNDIVIVQIDMDLSDPDVDEHWLLLVGADPDGSQFRYHDPWPKPEAQEVFTMPPGYCKLGWVPSRAITAHVRYAEVK